MADQDRFARSLHAVARGLARIGRDRARVSNVTPQQAETLQVIAERGAVSTSTLATLLGIDPSTASRNLAGLERSGLLTRKKGADDGRQTDVRLTPKGKRIADSLSNGSVKVYGGLLEKLARGDRSKAVDALEALANALDADAR
jgi:DNA-binding MarR family transcriptional regulator